MPRSGLPFGDDAESIEVRERVRHHALAAGLVERALSAFDDDDLESGPGAVQRGGQSRRAAAADEQVDHVRLASASFSTLIRVRSSAALSTVNTSAVIHAVCTSGSAKPSTTTAT